MPIFKKKFELLSSIYEEQKTENDILISKVEYLEKKLKIFAENEVSQFSESKIKIKSLEEKILEKENEEIQLIAKFKNMPQELENIKSLNSELVQKLEQSKQIFLELESENLTLKNELSILRENLKDIKEENEKLKKKNLSINIPLGQSELIPKKLLSKDSDYYEKNRNNIKKLVGSFKFEDAESVLEFGKTKNVFSKRDKKSLMNIVAKLKCGIKLTEIMLSEFIRFYQLVLKVGYLEKFEFNHLSEEISAHGAEKDDSSPKDNENEYLSSGEDDNNSGEIFNGGLDNSNDIGRITFDFLCEKGLKEGYVAASDLKLINYDLEISISSYFEAVEELEQLDIKLIY